MALFATVIAVWLVGVALLVIGAARSLDLRKFGAVLRAGAIGIGLPAVGGVTVIGVGLSRFPDPLFLLLGALGLIPLVISATSCRRLRRMSLEWSGDIRQR